MSGTRRPQLLHGAHLSRSENVVRTNCLHSFLQAISLDKQCPSISTPDQKPFKGKVISEEKKDQ